MVNSVTSGVVSGAMGPVVKMVAGGKGGGRGVWESVYNDKGIVRVRREGGCMESGSGMTADFDGSRGQRRLQE